MSFYLQHIKKIEHTVFWLFIWLFVFDYHFIENNWFEAIADTFLEVATYAIIIYFNLLILIPVFLKRKQVARYTVALTGTVLVYIFFIRFSGIEKQFYDYEGWRNIFSMVLNTSLFLLISLLYWYFKQWQVEREQQLILKSEKLEAELNFLRSQINPHFIFNTLNNIYTLSLQKHDNAAPMVAKLASLLRNILYESGNGLILLSKEIETLQQYIDLNLLRKPQSTNVDFYVEGVNSSWRITPMLLINFVENCFKHGNLDNDEKAFIKIGCEIDEQGKLIFTTENSCRNNNEPVLEAGGIGLKNAQRQLALNYAGIHELATMKENDTFKVKLILQLKMA